MKATDQLVTEKITEAKNSVTNEAKSAGCPFFGGIKKHEAQKLLADKREKGNSVSGIKPEGEQKSCPNSDGSQPAANN